MAPGRASQGPFGARAPAARRSFASLRTFAVIGVLAAATFGCGGERAGTPAPAPLPTRALGATIADLSGVNELLAADIQFTTDILDQLFLQLLSETGVPTRPASPVGARNIAQVATRDRTAQIQIARVMANARA